MLGERGGGGVGVSYIAWTSGERRQPGQLGQDRQVMSVTLPVIISSSQEPRAPSCLFALLFWGVFKKMGRPGFDFHLASNDGARGGL